MSVRNSNLARVKVGAGDEPGTSSPDPEDEPGSGDQGSGGLDDDAGRAAGGDPAADDAAGDASDETRRRLFLPLSRRDDDEERLADRLTQQFAQQWAAVRAERRAEPPVIVGGPSNFSRAQVPWGLDLAAAWSWRLIVISAATLAVLWVMRYFAVITVPLAIALLLSALAAPGLAWLRRRGVPRGISALVVLVVGIGAVATLLYFVGQQVANGAADLADQVVVGLGEIRTWIREGPLGVSDSQLDRFIREAQHTISSSAEPAGVISSVSEVGAVLTNVLAGFFIVLFSTYFFMADGDRIWSWLVRIAPRAGRERIDSSGRVAWTSLTQFVRATVIVALVDALGIALVAAGLGVPFVAAIGVLVFLGAFVPMIGATVAGSVAVLVALVDGGPFTALLMLAGVIAVQQIEGHVLQPFLMGRFVSLHPLGVIVAIAAGVLVAGIAGALIAVPLAAAANAVVLHLASWPFEVPVQPAPDPGPEPGGGALGESDA